MSEINDMVFKIKEDPISLVTKILTGKPISIKKHSSNEKYDIVIDQYEGNKDKVKLIGKITIRKIGFGKKTLTKNFIGFFDLKEGTGYLDEKID